VQHGKSGGNDSLGNTTLRTWKNVAHHLLCDAVMSTSFDSIYKKMASSLEAGGAVQVHEAKSDSARHISPAIAHELNNILTIIQGYADRLLLKHAEHPALETHLRLISEASRRAATLVRSAVSTETGVPVRSQPVSQPPAPVA
jgi:signal transduction histidine kinase